MGEVTAAREFVDAYQGILFDSGKVPCCHDARGADPVVENDSHGQYLYAVAEVCATRRDAAFLARHWPAVQRTVAYIDHLRQSSARPPTKRPSAPASGLMPPSISHGATPTSQPTPTGTTSGPCAASRTRCRWPAPSGRRWLQAMPPSSPSLGTTCPPRSAPRPSTTAKR